MVRLFPTLFAITSLAIVPSALALWPNPTSLSTGSTYLKLSSSFSISFTSGAAPSDLSAAIARTEGQLKNDQLQRLVVGRGAVDAAHLGSAKSLNSLTLSITPGVLVKGAQPLSIMQNTILEASQRNESYSLNVPADGSPATLVANNALGLFRGLTTFTQLFYVSGSTIYTYAAPVAIKDQPAFPIRGILLDTSRNFYPVADIYRTLDAMSWSKLNVFHWHVVDSQSFPLEVAAFPELAKAGAYDASSVYSVADVQAIVQYAGQRGIDVMMEIDTPGHTAAIADSHPDYIACNNAVPWTSYANGTYNKSIDQPPAGQLRLANKNVITFVTDLFISVIQNLPSKYFSTGGDEINDNCYTTDAETQAELTANKQTFEEALSSFTQNTHKALTQAGKIPVVWEEMVLSHNVTLVNGTVVLVWISSADAALVVEKGFQIVHVPSNYFYLDCGGGGWVGDNTAGNSWCDPYKTWQMIYSFDPYDSITAAQQPLVLGGETALWSEQSDTDSLDDKLWPRSAAAAEVFWTGANGPDGHPRNSTEALARLHDLRYRYVQRGVKAIALQPEWCALRPNACDL
ncbi:N-acetyl-glucosamine-6-phosphate deacetylase [Tulasnella sp. 330]|nr:N-acetyl-glucosamine-6-phosphate deacetylase [Tulasnella sp. 330]KAG8878477.1 N-acetyl-glucosamine-6-phosphate deacetylase [Tulasnella sp. 331]KAG8880164.1 N-acetyl-glucosamine-6-phosphate deacetylase [Tulasnella sp. 332]